MDGDKVSAAYLYLRGIGLSSEQAWNQINQMLNMMGGRREQGLQARRRRRAAGPR